MLAAVPPPPDTIPVIHMQWGCAPHHGPGLGHRCRPKPLPPQPGSLPAPSAYTIAVTLARR